MDELMDLIIADESPSEISDTIKNTLFAKAGERVDALKPYIANTMLGYDIDDETGETIDPEAQVDEVDAEEEPVGELDNDLENEEED